MTDVIIQTDAVTKSYQNGQVEVLNAVSFSVHRGEKIALMGPSGSGKSTFIALLAGLDRPTSGRVLLVGQDLATFNEDSLAKFRAKHLSIVFQQFHLMPAMSAMENVALPLLLASESHARERAQDALKQVGLEHRLHHRPHQLSGGECQRVAIARAIVVEPSMILADEPTGNLDRKTGDQILNILLTLSAKKNITLLLVTHNEELASHCEKTYHLRDGKLNPSK